MRSISRIVVAVAVVAAAVGLGVAVSLDDRAGGSPAPSAPVPALASAQFNDLDGTTRRLAALQGEWTVVNFWATWCAPCVEEMPELQRVGAEFANRGVVVVGIGIDNVAAMRRFRDDNKIAFPLLAAGAGGTELARDLGNPSGALPFTVLVDKEGRVVQRRLGRISEAELRRWLAASRPAAGG